MLLYVVRQRLGSCKLRGRELIEEVDRRGAGCRIRNPAFRAGCSGKIGLLAVVGGRPLVGRLLFVLWIEVSVRSVLGVLSTTDAFDGGEEMLLTRGGCDDLIAIAERQSFGTPFPVDSGRTRFIPGPRALFTWSGVFIADGFSACCVAALSRAIARCVFAIWTSLLFSGGVALALVCRLYPPRFCGLPFWNLIHCASLQRPSMTRVPSVFTTPGGGVIGIGRASGMLDSVAPNEKGRDCGPMRQLHAVRLALAADSVDAQPLRITTGDAMRIEPL
jgi:hypothetical protein